MYFPPLSKSITQLRPSVIREMSTLAKNYTNVINLGIGEPDLETPQEITERAFADARKGHTHYTASQGDPELVDKLSLEIHQATGIAVASVQILITHGAMGGLTAALRTLLEPGDEVLLFEPHFPDYLGHIALAGGIPVPIASRIENRFVPDKEDILGAITPKTKVMVLNSPNNPTGAVLDEETLDELAEIAVSHDIFVLSDEVYDQILFSASYGSIFTRPEMQERALVIKSFSKNYSMTGWRIGYCYGPTSLVNEMMKVVNYSTACANSVGQRAAVAALALDSRYVEEARDKYASRAQLVWSELKEIPRVRVLKPQGSFYIFVDIKGITKDSRKFALELLHQEQVVVIPGYAFGASGEGCFRIACTTNEDTLSEAMARLRRFLSQRP